MDSLIKTSRKLAFDLLITLQALFLVTTIWDFLFTVLVPGSYRALVFSGLGSVATVSLVIVPWALCITFLVITFVIFLVCRDHRPIQSHIHYYYGFLGLMYLGFTLLALSNPLITWPIVINYIVNVVWAASIVYYRIVIRKLHDNADVMK